MDDRVRHRMIFSGRALLGGAAALLLAAAPTFAHTWQGSAGSAADVHLRILEAEVQTADADEAAELEALLGSAFESADADAADGVESESAPDSQDVCDPSSDPSSDEVDATPDAGTDEACDSQGQDEADNGGTDQDEADNGGTDQDEADNGDGHGQDEADNGGSDGQDEADNGDAQDGGAESGD